MDKHTFKIGDRVQHSGSKRIGYITCIPGERRGERRGPSIRPDCDVDFGTDSSQCWLENLSHDIDFQVGDWVRYEGVEDGHVPNLEGEVGIVTCTMGVNTVGVKFPAYWNPDALWYKANLVKIQPPQKDSDDTIIHVFTSYTNKGEKNMRNVFGITHEKYGVVQGVHQVAPGCYCKNGAYYYHGEGWREIEEWVKIEVLKRDWDRATKHGSKYMLIGGYGVLYREVK